ncbi:hypothetical protein GI374_06885 [Paracoccus sp. S-4012]|nr:hypothetical protein [Paracoccus sp. S-4012]
MLRSRIVGTDAEVARVAEDAATKRRGRVAVRFIIALPVEATPEQRVELTRAFAEALTHGTASYVGAIHDKKGNDRSNPHFHLVAFDAFEKSGGRGRPRSVMGMARKGAVEAAAALWARIHNERMTAWGYGASSLISELSNEARGIDRIPTIHEGPGARQMAARGAVPAAKPAWRRIDAGQTRSAANKIICEINQLKEEETHGNQPDGLGSRDDRDPHERREGRPVCGSDRGRGRADARPAAPPFVADGRPDEGADEGRVPPFRTAGADPDGPSSPPFRQPEQAPPPRLWLLLSVSSVLSAAVASAVCLLS